MSRTPMLPAMVLAGLMILQGPAALAADPAPVNQVPWQRLTDAQRQEANSLAQDYMRFLGEAKIPLHRTRYLKAQLDKAGFRPFTANEKWQPGAKYYVINRDRALLAFVVGKRPLKDGIRLIGAHLDSPRLDLRIRPLKTAEGFALLKTQPYGGIKRYQWSNLPLALVGQVARSDGKLVDVSIGEAPGDPVLLMPDLAPHVDKDYRTRTADQVFKGDELNVLAGTVPDLKGSVTRAVLEELNKRYGLTEEDFVSADLSLVPATAPREVGLDRSMIGGYGQDDGLCSYVATRVLMAMGSAPERTAVVYLVDNEEVGNINTTGARSRFFTATLDRFLAREAGRETSGEALSAMLETSDALSADVSQSINPNFPGTEDPLTTARLGQGFSLKTMKPGYDASPAFRSRLRQILSEHKIPWQTYAYKVDGGGGGTIGTELQELNMDVVDVGAPLLAMHGTYELSSKSDLYSLRRFFDAYFKAP